ncbi:MAG: hypothetical protein DWB56_14765 [Candidatus Jettenia sp.]|uniref:Uncharacterized protein n=1 Tax=Candidatus Jettenia caeni TaxID=247490 RepID=I3ILT5_9BACT|nr:hypothetical protein [Candidatus Jettenia sp. AMX1]KAA0243594.1 MAG: hypothetical protein EDM70_10080 [Candidatus Brocadia sp. AMX2]MBC6930194.1 hypothetical protein [Candidatus Jettenia sp.]GAB62680.1 hypothetical protein KSU1_C1084 [Candidatus Jettenia caeni]MCQ3927068.1 hypothetical protein [Candidatus Jettenia sp.]MDL1939907.1 hypothetical protein [Candidatus Jettenia sp. AMX1]
MAEKYRPANGAEGILFEVNFCDVCEKGDYADSCCDINVRTLFYDVDEAEYPAEWTYDAAGKPVCTAFKGITPS